LKKKLQNDKEKRKKRGNVRKIEKKDAKSTQLFQKRTKMPLKRRGGCERIVAKCLWQNETG